jgi:ATP-binding cassette, subfamily B, bacterial
MAAIENSLPKRRHADVLASVLRCIWTGPSPIRRAVAIVAAIELANIGLGVVGPFLLKSVIDGFTIDRVSQPYALTLVVLFVATWAVAGMLSSWRLVHSTGLIDYLAATMIGDALRGELPRSACTRERDSGQTLGVLERLPFSLLVVVDGILWRVLPLAVQILISVSVLAGLVPWHFSVLLFGVLIGHGALSLYSAQRHRDHSDRANWAASVLSGTVGDLLRNARRVVFNGAIKQELDLVASVALDKSQANHRMTWSLVRSTFLQFGWIGLGLASLLAVGADAVLGNIMTVGDFVMLETYAFRLAVPLSSVGFILSQSSSALSTIGDALSLGAPERKPGARASDRPSPGPASVQLGDVSFRYPGSSFGIERVSVDLKPGSFNVIVGPNGSGKSTLAQLIAGVLPPERGVVRIGDCDLGGVTPEERHRWVLYVPQFIGLLNRPLGANALYPPTDLSANDLSALLLRWRFYADDREVDLQLHVGEHGGRLSGGQIQKLELARLVGVKVPVLVLDESTSALDPASEASILMELFGRHCSDTTIVVVTHRRMIAQKADSVLFMCGGRLVGQGQHEGLMASSPEYVHFWG